MSRSVVFIHGPWIHSVSWLPWQELFDKQGYSTLAPGWPGDGETVADTRTRPERVAGVGVDAVTDAYAHIIHDLAPGRPLFEASTAHLRRTSPTSVDPRRAGAPAELRTYADRGHSAPFDSGWREIADDTLAWLESNGLTS